MGKYIENFTMLYDQVGLISTDYSVEDQYLRLIAIDGVDGTYYKIESKGGWSFSEPDEILGLIESFIKMREALS